MKGTVCQLHYHGGGCLRSVHPRPSGSSCEATWPFATAPQGLKVGDAVTFTLAEGGQAVDLQVTASGPSTEGEAVDLQGPKAVTFRTLRDGERTVDLEVAASGPKRDPEPFPMTSQQTDRETAALKVRAEAAAQRKLQRNMNRFHNANLEEQLEMLIKAEEGLKAVKAGDEVDGTALCSLINKLAGFLHAPGDTIIAVASPAGDAPAVAGSRNAGVQQKVRKLLIGCLELLDLSDSTTYESVACAVKHITHLVTLKQLKQNQPDDENPSSSFNKKRKVAVDQWQTLAALVGACQDDALLLAPASAVHGKAAKREMRGKDMSTTKDGCYQPNTKVSKLPSVSQDSQNVVTLKCSQCEQTMTSNWFWRHPKHKTMYVLVPNHGHGACGKKMGRKCPWLPTDDRPRKLDNFEGLDFCEHKRQRTTCVACGGARVCEHKKQYFDCKFCKGLGSSSW